jgi:hypothetical protein
MEMTVERLTEIEEDLSSRAFLFENPATYRQAIEITFKQLRAALELDFAVA